MGWKDQVADPSTLTVVNNAMAEAALDKLDAEAAMRDWSALSRAELPARFMQWLEKNRLGMS